MPIPNPLLPFARVPSLAVDFDAANERWQFGDLAGVPDSDIDFTIEAWNFFTALTGWKEYMGKAASNQGWYIESTSSGGSDFEINFDDARVAPLGITQAVNIWTYHCWVHTAATNTVQAYYGTLPGTLTVGTLTSSIAGPTTTTGGMCVGGHDLYPGDGGTGRLALVRVWSAALREDQLRKIWNKRFTLKTCPYPNLAFLWDANQDINGTGVDQMTRTLATVQGTPVQYFVGPPLGWIIRPQSGGITAAFTAFVRDLASTIAHSAAVTRVATMGRAPSSSVSHTASAARQATMARALAATDAHSATVARVYGAQRQVASTIGHTATVARQATMGRSLSSSIAHTGAVARAMTMARGLASTISHSAAVTRALTMGRALASTIGHTPVLSRTMTMARGLSSSISHSATLARLGIWARTLATTISHGADVSAVLNGGSTAFNRALSSTISHAATLARTMAMGRAASSTATHAASVARQAGMGRGSTSTIGHSASVARTLSLVRLLSSTIAHSAVVTRLGNWARGLVSTIGHLVSLSRQQAIGPGHTITPAMRQRTIAPAAQRAFTPRRRQRTWSEDTP